MPNGFIDHWAFFMLIEDFKKIVSGGSANRIGINPNSLEFYNRLKHEISKKKNFAKKYLDPKAQGILLQLSTHQRDYTFASFLVDEFGLQKKDHPEVQLGLARYYSDLQNPVLACRNYWPLFKKNKLRQIYDYENLLEQLKMLARFRDCDEVISQALKIFPDSIDIKLSTVLYQLAISHLYPRNRELTTNNLEYLSRRCNTVDQFFKTGFGYFLSGNLEAGIRHVNHAFETLTIPKITYSKPPGTYTADKCLASTQQIIKLAETQGSRPFLIGGTLLGMVRDRKLMDYDKDADLGILISNPDQIRPIVEAICKEKNFVAPGMIRSPAESQHWNVAIIDQSQGIAVDLFFFYEINGKYYEGVHTSLGTLKWEFSKFDLGTLTVDGFTYFVPHTAETFLEELYGSDWRIPISGWDSLVDCPNLTKDSFPNVLYFGLTRLYAAASKGDIKTARRYVDSLASKWGFEFDDKFLAKISTITS